MENTEKAIYTILSIKLDRFVTLQKLWKFCIKNICFFFILNTFFSYSRYAQLKMLLFKLYNCIISSTFQSATTFTFVTLRNSYVLDPNIHIYIYVYANEFIHKYFKSIYLHCIRCTKAPTISSIFQPPNEEVVSHLSCDHRILLSVMYRAVPAHFMMSTHTQTHTYYRYV